MRAYLRACVRACVHACVRACACVCMCECACHFSVQILSLFYTSTEKKKVPEVKSGEDKPRSKLRLVLKPLPNDEEDTTGDYPTKLEGFCGDTCAGGQEVAAESASEKCSSQGSMFSSNEDEFSSCRDVSESQLPLPSSQGTSKSTNTLF